MKKLKYTWQDFDRNLKQLVKQITSDPDYFITGVYGIPRGGLVPAVMLSHYLNVPLVLKTNITSNTLVIDDISDTGITLEKHFEQFKKRNIKPYTLTLFVKPKTRFIPTFYARKTSRWVVYPWETNYSTK